jgi:hypothetical protein
MHKCVGLAVLLLALAVVLPLAAQQQAASSFLTGVQPQDVHFQKVNIARASQAFNNSPVVQAPTVNKVFNPSSFFIPKLPNLSWLPKLSWSKPTPPPPQRRKKGQ